MASVHVVAEATPWGSTDCLDTIHHSQRTEAGGRAAGGRSFRAGEAVAGYRLLRKIGEGSQAEVWEARSQRPEAGPVALRLLRLDRAERPADREAFLRSAELTRSLESDALLPTLAVGEADGTAYQAIPLVLGANLADAIASRRAGGDDDGREGAWWCRLRPWAYRRAIVEAMAGIARALAEAHGHGVVHRDIKPTNILLDREGVGRARLADFGLGGAACPEPTGSRSSGTPMYMAPERLLGLPSDPIRGDIFALGLTLHEALTLGHPRSLPRGLHRSLVPAYLASSRPPPPRAICPAISERVEAVILRAIAPDPALRYHDVSTLADELERSLRTAPPAEIRTARATG